MGEGQIRVLGSLHLHSGGGRVSVGSETSLRLLASLVAAEGGFLASTDLSERLWGQDAPGSRLRMAVSRLRGRLAEVALDDLLVTMSGGYRLERRPGAIDAGVFQHLVDDARAVALTSPDRAMAMLMEGLALWTGPAFDGLGSEVWLAGTVERLREQRLAAEDLLAGLQLRAGRAPAILDRLQRAVEDEPLREERWVHLVTALGATTRRSEALRALDRARRVLGRTVGLGLGPELRGLEQDLLSGAGAGPTPAPWHATLDLVGRDAELLHLRRLLRSARVAVVIGLGGVGKSALATAFVAEVEAAGLAVLRTAVDGVASPEELRAQLAATVGLQGTDDPEGLFDAIARRAPRAGLWVVDGAEADEVAVAEVIGALTQAIPALRFVITSRVPVPLPGAVPLPLEPLAIGSVEEPGPAMRVLADHAGVVLEVASAADREAVARLARRGGGVPLALELLAAASVRTGLHALATRDESPNAPILEGLQWALAAMPAACRTLVLRMAQLSSGCSPELARRLQVDDEDVAATLGPAVQARVVQPMPAADGDGYRYQLAEPLREALIELAGPAEAAAVHDQLLGLARDVGRLHGPADAVALAVVETELDNLRNWLARIEGSAEGVELATALARAWQELGLGGDGAAWLQLQVAGAPGDDPGAAAARIAAGVIHGWLDIAAEDRVWLQQSNDAVAGAGDWESWLHGTTLAVLAIGRSGTDVEVGAELLIGQAAQDALQRVGDPWFSVQRQAVLALGPLGAGNFTQARIYLRGIVDQYLALGDPSTALQHLAHSVTIGRVIRAWDAIEEDLETAAPLEALGLARGATALLAVERAEVRRGRGDGPEATRAMHEAIERLERAGGLRQVAARRVGLASWLVEDDRSAEALAQVRIALPTLLRYDPLGAAMALGILVGLVEGAVAAQLAGASQRLGVERGVVALTEEELAVHDARLAAAAEGSPEDAAQGAALGDDELLELVASIELG